MTPDFLLFADGADRTAVLRDRLLSLRVVDAAGLQSDTLEMTFDDREPAIETPRKGASLTLSIGWLGQALVPQGRYVVDEVTREGPYARLTVAAKAADMRASLKSPKSRGFEGKTIGAIVSQIAGEHGLEPKVGSAFASKVVKHRAQTGESDLHFLSRLARDVGAVCAPKDGKLLFVAKGTGQSASGKPLAPLAVVRTDLVRWRGVAADRGGFGKVKARWRDLKTAKTKFAEAGSGEPVRTLRHLHATEEEAKSAAKAALERGQRSAGSLDLEFALGRPGLQAETPIDVSGLTDDLNGRWFAERVEHSIDFAVGGFTTRVDCVPQLKAPGETEAGA